MSSLYSYILCDGARFDFHNYGKGHSFQESCKREFSESTILIHKVVGLIFHFATEIDVQLQACTVHGILQQSSKIEPYSNR
jgi:hypothetical protein